MRPRKLEMQGFTCFTDQVEIDFDGFDVFAITGRTGSGKTTIMDALCYALYGKVPRGTSAGSLMSRDVKHMHVALEFEAGEGRYRVTRGSNMPSKSATPFVQFERSAGDDQWEPLENRVREAGAAIERVIGLDYGAFTRCVLLPQGKFQEMLAGSREERRKVLEDLLDIGIYDRIRAAANTRATDMNRDAKLLQNMLDTTFAGATEEALAACKAAITETRPRLDIETKRRDALMQASQHATAWKEIREGEQKRNEQLQKLHDRRSKAEQLAQTGAAELAQLHDAFDAATAALAAAVYDQPRHLALIAARADAEQVARCEEEAQRARTIAGDLTAVTRAQASAETTAIAETEALAAVDAAEAALVSAQRADAATHVRSGLKKGDACPVCGGVVGALPKTQSPALTATEKAAASARRLLDDARTASARAQQALAVGQQRAQQAVDAATSAEAQLTAARTSLSAHLPDGEPGAVAPLTARIVELERAAQSRAAAAAELEVRRTAADEQQRAVTAAAQERFELTGQISALEEAASEDRARAEVAMAEIKAIVARWKWGDVEDLIDAHKYPGTLLANMHAEAQRACSELARRLGTLEQQQRTLKDQIREAKQHRARLGELQSEGALYTEIATLLHANNFREWYIGEATAMLAEAASQRLEALDPDRRYGLTAAGLDFSVIDRWHADEERSPSTLSGGETFVVSLALALALAEQLPRIQTAARTVLESLFLDEGFGTLDADTLDPVMTALEGLRMEGRLVGIVTHVRELAERIGTRIEVRKSPSGSTIEVVMA